MPLWKPKTAAILPVRDAARSDSGEPVRYGVRQVGPLRSLPSENQSRRDAAVVFLWADVHMAKIPVPEREK